MNEEDIRQLIEQEVKGAKTAVEKMLFYYASSLQTAGIQDVRQYIATQICSMIDLTEEQAKFVRLNIEKDNKIYSNLENSIMLLSAMEESKELDLDSIKIIKQVLELMKNDLESFVIENEQGE